jgi:hypothetical protein
MVGSEWLRESGGATTGGNVDEDADSDDDDEAADEVDEADEGEACAVAVVVGATELTLGSVGIGRYIEVELDTARWMAAPEIADGCPSTELAWLMTGSAPATGPATGTERKSGIIEVARGGNGMRKEDMDSEATGAGAATVRPAAVVV